MKRKEQMHMPFFKQMQIDSQICLFSNIKDVSILILFLHSSINSKTVTRTKRVRIRTLKTYITTFIISGRLK